MANTDSLTHTHRYLLLFQLCLVVSDDVAFFEQLFLVLLKLLLPLTHRHTAVTPLVHTHKVHFKHAIASVTKAFECLRVDMTIKKETTKDSYLIGGN